MGLKLMNLRFRIARTILTLFWGSWITLGAIIRMVSSPKRFFYAKTYLHLPDCAKALVDTSDSSSGYLSITTSDQKHLKIYYVSQGDEKNPLMLCLHGFPECWYSWRYQLKEFSKSYRVVAVDCRGYGESDKPKDLEAYALDNLIEDVPAIIKSLGYETATVVGHDWGGAITWGFASRYPEMCDKVVVLNCPHPSAQSKAFMSSPMQLLASWYMFYFLIPYLPEIVMKSNDYAMLAATFRGRKGGVRNKQNLTSADLDVFKYTLNSWEARVASHNYIRANLTYRTKFGKGKITPPMMLIWSTEDLFLTKQLAEMSKGYAENIQVKYVEGASHWVQQDYPEEVNSLIHDFVTN